MFSVSFFKDLYENEKQTNTAAITKIQIADYQVCVDTYALLFLFWAQVVRSQKYGSKYCGK